MPKVQKLVWNPKTCSSNLLYTLLCSRSHTPPVFRGKNRQQELQCSMMIERVCKPKGDGANCSKARPNVQRGPYTRCFGSNKISCWARQGKNFAKLPTIKAPNRLFLVGTISRIGFGTDKRRIKVISRDNFRRKPSRSRKIIPVHVSFLRFSALLFRKFFLWE